MVWWFKQTRHRTSIKSPPPVSASIFGAHFSQPTGHLVQLDGTGILTQAFRSFVHQFLTKDWWIITYNTVCIIFIWWITVLRICACNLAISSINHSTSNLYQDQYDVSGTNDLQWQGSTISVHLYVKTIHHMAKVLESALEHCALFFRPCCPECKGQIWVRQLIIWFGACMWRIHCYVVCS